ncbi:head-tail connector protein [Alkalihalophilus marmarensis]|uniref:head-tail connector protein n=1 Tax=Alkalihalophilus marmarensis TaxID=521377 RepID=UPI00203FA22B|nr:head-tail connector protein [Alkalihalophilus marmarensis]MCM3489083.1 head-tail connector protein [Alkalihalophilus marmarensis]
MELEELKRYLRMDYEMETEEEQDLLKFYSLAKIYIKNQGVRLNPEDPDMVEQFNQACAMLTEHWYDNRQSYRIGNQSYEIPYSLDSIVRQLKYCYGGDAE